MEADLLKRSYTPTYAQSIYDSEFKLYKSNVEPNRETADLELNLKEKWCYPFCE
ncbi:MAG: hypothetical protein ACJATI_004327 [Halioglobus sp.]|jgi:hypothetical protein